MGLGGYLGRRLLLFIPSLLLASVTIFVIMRALPGDAAGAMLGGEGESVRPELVASLRGELGLDRPLYVQYGLWLRDMVSGDFGGRSLATREPVATLVRRTVLVTLQLTLYAVVVAVVVWVPLGALAAVTRGQWPDVLARAVGLVGAAVPGFWIAMLVLVAVVRTLGWSPPLGYAHLWIRPLDHIQMMMIPALVLAWEYGAHLMRTTRAGMLEALAQDFVRTARSKGLPGWAVTLRHALRATTIPLVTSAGLHLGTLLSGAILLEFVFGLPGLGRALVSAVQARDYPVVQSLAMLLVAGVLLLNLLIDLVYALADPRVSYGD